VIRRRNRSITPNYSVIATVRPVTPLACASVAPVHPARYALRQTARTKKENVVTSTTQDVWKDRFHAVARSQSRYLYLLLLVSLFYWALRVGAGEDAAGDIRRTHLSLLDLSLDSRVVLASAPIVIGVVIAVPLGTFHAVTVASQQLGLSGDREFERFDVHPTAIDLAFYTANPRSAIARWGLLTYPAAISIAFVEAAWLWGFATFALPAFPGQHVLSVIGAITLLSTLPRLLTLWLSKARKAVHR